MNEIEKIRDVLEKDDNVIFALLFGSYALDKPKKNSDIDIAVYLEEMLNDNDFFSFISKLSRQTNKEIDIVFLNTASVFMRHQVFKYGIPIVVKDRLKYIRFREKNMDDYEEYNYISGMNIYDRP